jgi:hypothetical protein
VRAQEKLTAFLEFERVMAKHFYCRHVDTKTISDRKNKLGLSVAIGAGVGAALGVALHHLPLWLSLGYVGGIVTGIILGRE